MVLEHSCGAKPGETLLIIVDNVILPYVSALTSAALKLRLVPLAVDIRSYLASPQYKQAVILKPLKAAIESADIVIENLPDTWVANRPDFGRLTGNPDLQDKSLTGERRWFIVQSQGMEYWNIHPEELSAIRKRTLWLIKLLKTAKNGTITSRIGTHFTFGLGRASKCTPILGIVPLYGEVAITPDLAPTFGTFIVDGPTQHNVRPANQLDRPPLRIVVERGRAIEISGGDRVQRTRLAKFIRSGRPAADAIDEIGVVTTQLIANDFYYWSDGTHHHDRIHVALGNNNRRDTLVHGPRHMDCEICRPTLAIDDVVVVHNGMFRDRLIC
jgi:hypothetical protein